MNAISVIRLLPDSKEQVENFSKQVLNTLNSGEINPLDLLLNIKGFEAVIKDVKDRLDELALIDAQKYSEKTFDYKNAELQVKEAVAKWDFTNCGDIKLNFILKNEESIINQRKERETFLKSIKQSMTIIDDQSGEVYEVFPPQKSSKTIVYVKIK